LKNSNIGVYKNRKGIQH